MDFLAIYCHGLVSGYKIGSREWFEMGAPRHGLCCQWSSTRVYLGTSAVFDFHNIDNKRSK